MKMLNRGNLVPWSVRPLSDEEWLEERRAVSRMLTDPPRPGMPVTPFSELRGRMLSRCGMYALDRADRAWLRDNLPAGTVFNHLGHPIMVFDHFYDRNNLGYRKCWRAKCHVPMVTGLVERDFTVAELRAFVEPGSLVPRSPMKEEYVAAALV